MKYALFVEHAQVYQGETQAELEQMFCFVQRLISIMRATAKVEIYEDRCLAREYGYVDGCLLNPDAAALNMMVSDSIKTEERIR